MNRLTLTRRRGLMLGASALAAACSPKAEAPAPEATAPIGDPFAEDALRADLEFLDQGEFLQTGGLGDIATAQRTEARLVQAGFEISRQNFQAPGFDVQRAELEVNGEAIPVAPQAIVVPTGPDGIEAPMRIWRSDADTPAMKDAIAMVMLPSARHSRLLSPQIKPALDAALSAGPRAVVLITNGPSGETIYLNAPYAKSYADIPIATLGPKPGAAALAAAEQGATGKLVVDGKNQTRNSWNLIGRITGRGPAVVVSTPRTGWVRCVAERGPGFAAFMAMAAWAPKALPGNDLVFVSNCAHEYDNAGSRAFIEHAAPAPEHTHLWVHLGAGLASRALLDNGEVDAGDTPTADPLRYVVGTDDTLDVLREAFAGQPGLENPTSASQGAAGELGEIIEHGFPRTFGAFSGNPFHHTIADRIDKTDAGLTRQMAIAFRDATLKLANG
ncbi:MAG: hypothetical protein R3C52_14820 [Hyphomonadaceae bacterium]